jgi:hypothetical protein
LNENDIKNHHIDYEKRINNIKKNNTKKEEFVTKSVIKIPKGLSKKCLFKPLNNISESKKFERQNQYIFPSIIEKSALEFFKKDSDMKSFNEKLKDLNNFKQVKTKNKINKAFIDNEEEEKLKRNRY